jgi:type II secretory pathway pseudopilin PulG
LITRILLKFKVFCLRFRVRVFKIKNPELPAYAETLRAGRRTNDSKLLFKNRGFTLIEIIVLIVMAGIIIPAIVVPFVTGVKGSGKPEMVTTAMYLAHQKMEELMKFNYNRAELAPTNLIACPTPPPSGYQWQYEILYVPSNDLMATGSVNPPETNYKRIRVRVTDSENSTYEVYAVVTNFP